MNNKPLVSIITPSFNQGAYLEQTIQSVIGQTYSNIEYIIIDGGSDDNSVEIISKYASRLQYWVSEQDKGQADAINKGLTKARGDIVAYLNSDDVLELDAVQKMVDAFEKWPESAVIYGTCAIIDEQNNQIKPPAGKQTNLKRLLIKGMTPDIHQPACFFNLAKIKRRPLFNDELRFVMDYELLLYCFTHKLHIHFIPDYLANFRMHNQAKTSAQAMEMYEEKMRIQRQYAPQLWLLWLFRNIKHHLRKIITNTH